MTLGDRALLLCPSQYAYGPRGSGNIPGDAFLMFDVHILGVNGEWIEMPDAPEEDAEEDRRRMRSSGLHMKSKIRALKWGTKTT